MSWVLPKPNPEGKKKHWRDPSQYQNLIVCEAQRKDQDWTHGDYFRFKLPKEKNRQVTGENETEEESLGSTKQREDWRLL